MSLSSALIFLMANQIQLDIGNSNRVNALKKSFCVPVIHWQILQTGSGLPDAINSLNSFIRKAIKKRKIFRNDDFIKKIVYQAITEAFKKWSMPINNWRQAMVRFIIEFADRLEKIH